MVVVLAVDWAAFGVALAALVWTISWAVVQHFGNRDRDRRIAERDAKIADLQAAQAAALTGIERATAAGIDPAVADAFGAAISLELLWASPGSGSHGDLFLVVKNLGPGGAIVKAVTVETSGPGSAASGIYNPNTVPPAVPGELYPGESLSTRLFPSIATRFPIEIGVTWLDGTGDIRHRTRHLNAPP
jgi:hypothetical protein